jgi:hypothetical protein
VGRAIDVPWVAWQVDRLMPWASANEAVVVDEIDLVAGSPAIDVEVKVSDGHSWEACQGNSTLPRRHDDLQEVRSV